MRRPQRGAKAVRIARLFQQLARFGRIVRPRLIALRIRDSRRQHAGGRGGIARKSDLHQRLAVNGIVNGFAHLRIIERLLRDVHADVALHDRRAGDQLQLAVFLQNGGLLVRDRERKLRLAGLQHRRTGVVIHYRTPGDGVQLRQPFLPVARVFLHLHKIGLIPGDQLVRTGTDRVEADLLAVFLQRGRGDHRRRRVRQNIDKRGERLFQGDFYRRRVDHLGFGDVFIEVITLEAVLRIAGAIQVYLHRVRIKVGAVLELHPGFELNGVHQPVIRNGVPLRQHVFKLHLFIQAKQALVERFRHRLGERVVSVIRIQRGEVRADGDHHIFGSERGGSGQGCRHARG